MSDGRFADGRFDCDLRLWRVGHDFKVGILAKGSGNTRTPLLCGFMQRGVLDWLAES
jgi:hypothetical protein